MAIAPALIGLVLLAGYLICDRYEGRRLRQWRRIIRQTERSQERLLDEQGTLAFAKRVIVNSEATSSPRVGGDGTHTIPRHVWAVNMILSNLDSIGEADLKHMYQEAPHWEGRLHVLFLLHAKSPGAFERLASSVLDRANEELVWNLSFDMVMVTTVGRVVDQIREGMAWSAYYDLHDTDMSLIHPIRATEDLNHFFRHWSETAAAKEEMAWRTRGRRPLRSPRSDGHR